MVLHELKHLGPKKRSVPIDENDPLTCVPAYVISSGAVEFDI